MIINILILLINYIYIIKLKFKIFTFELMNLYYKKLLSKNINFFYFKFYLKKFFYKFF